MQCQQPIRSCYYVYRRELQQLYQRLIARIPTPVIRRAAKRFGLLKRNEIQFQRHWDKPLLIDHCLHEPLVHGRTILERYEEESAHVPSSDAEKCLLYALKETSLTLVSIERAYDQHALWVEDLSTKQSFPLYNRVLTNEPPQVSTLLVTRLIHLPELTLSSAFCFPLYGRLQLQAKQLIQLSMPKQFSENILRLLIQDVMIGQKELHWPDVEELLSAMPEGHE